MVFGNVRGGIEKRYQSVDPFFVFCRILFLLEIGLR